MSDIGPYGVTQNPDATAITANAMVGERAGSVTGNEFVGTSAATFSTAPYVPPNSELKPSGRLCLKATCRNHHSRDSDYCRWHQP